jgi:hypothetical protein
MTVKHSKKNNFDSRLRRTIINGLNKATDMLEAKLIEKVTIEDYSIYELVKNDYPYSKRHSINSAKHPDDFINRQSGKLSRSIKRIAIRFRGDKAKSKLYINASDCPYIVYLINGTYKMRPRNPFLSVYNENIGYVSKIILDEIKGAK